MTMLTTVWHPLEMLTTYVVLKLSQDTGDEFFLLWLFFVYPDALKSVFQGKHCSVYLLEENGFQRNKTSWSAELVCENEVQVVDEIVIDDLYSRLLDEESNERLIIHRYEYCAEYRKIISNQIVDRLIRFEIDLNSITEIDSRFSKYYKAIVAELIQITDGHLLP